MLQKTGILLTAILGLVFLALYVFMNWQWKPLPQEPVKLIPSFGHLLLDSVPLGGLTTAGKGIVAGNERGELLVFSSLEPDNPPIIHTLSKYPIIAPVLVKDNCYYVGDENGTFWCYSPEKGGLWSYKTGNQISGSAIYSDGLIWVGSHDQSLYALNAQTGEVHHTIECNGQINGTPLFSESDKMLYLGNCDGNLRKVDIQQGTIVGELNFESPIPESPALYGGLLYLLCHNGTLGAVDPVSFEVHYRIETGKSYVTTPYPTDSFLFLTDSDGIISVHDRKTGALITVLPEAEGMTPLRAGSDTAVYAVSQEGKLYEWKNQNGEWKPRLLQDFQTDCRTGVLLCDNVLLFADDSGGLFYYRLEIQ